jgi:uncharacterized membrane protein
MRTVIGLFETFSAADRAYASLYDAGISQDAISVITQEDAVRDYITQNPGNTSETAQGAATGATIGGLAGILTGIAAITIPVVGPVISAGTIATVLGSAALGVGVGAAGGGLVGALIDDGISESDAQVYVRGVERGNILLMARVDDAIATRVQSIMINAGALDIEAQRNT